MKLIISKLEEYVRREKKPREYALDLFLDFLVELFDVQPLAEERFAEHVRMMRDKSPEMMDAAIEWLNVTGEKIETDGWCDTLGNIYEMMYQSKGKASALGQFFTPESICDLMAKIGTCGQPLDKDSRIGDCACGSGRTLLAAYSILKGGYYIGEDIDHMSVKMCALNLMVHGAAGRVICHDTLRNPVNFDWGYEINEVRYPVPTPFYSLRRISNPKKKEPAVEIKKTKPENNKPEQLTLNF